MAAKKKPTELIMVSFRTSPAQVKKLKQFALDADVPLQLAIQHFITIGLASGSVPK